MTASMLRARSVERSSTHLPSLHNLLPRSNSFVRSKSQCAAVARAYAYRTNAFLQVLPELCHVSTVPRLHAGYSTLQLFTPGTPGVLHDRGALEGHL